MPQEQDEGIYSLKLHETLYAAGTNLQYTGG